jgi:hypothetical protein
MMQVNLGTGSITGGDGMLLGNPVPMNSLTISSFTLDLACNVDFGPLAPGCQPDGPPMFPPQKIAFVGMVPGHDTCLGSTFAPSIGGVGNNVVTFTATPPVSIPHDNPTLPGACSVQFNLSVEQPFSSDSTTDLFEEVVGYGIAGCDNGVLVSGGFQTSAIKVSPVTDNFTCYQIPRRVAGKPLNISVHLEDVFTAPSGGVDLLVGRPHRLCAPTMLLEPPVPNQDQVNLNGDHLEDYDYQNVPPSFPTIKGVTVTNVFGTITGDIKGTPARLLVPTGKGLKKAVVPPQDPNHPHYQCYPFANPKGNGKAATGVSTNDQFGMLDNFKINPDLLLCASVDKDGGDPDAVTTPTFLMCYEGNPPFGSQEVTLTNQFNLPPFNLPSLHTTIDNWDNLCVTSTVSVP